MLKLISFLVALVALTAFFFFKIGLPGVSLFVHFVQIGTPNLSEEDVMPYVKFALLMSGLVAAGFAIEIARIVDGFHRKFLRMLH